METLVICMVLMLLVITLILACVACYLSYHGDPGPGATVATFERKPPLFSRPSNLGPPWDGIPPARARDFWTFM